MKIARRTALGMLRPPPAVRSPSRYSRKPPQTGGTLVMVVQPEPPTLASYQSTSGPIGQLATKVYEGLLEYDFELKPRPGTPSMDRKSRRQDHHVPAQEGSNSTRQPFTSEDVKSRYWTC